MEKIIANEIRDSRLLPYVQRHEFEALVLAGLDAFKDFVDDYVELKNLELLKMELGDASPEDVNDGRMTAPSKRLEQIMDYDKTFHGPLVTKITGLLKLREKCPRFNNWVTKLESLGQVKYSL